MGAIAEINARVDAKRAANDQTLVPKSVDQAPVSLEEQGAASVTPTSKMDWNGLGKGLVTAAIGASPFGKMALGVGGTVLGTVSALGHRVQKAQNTDKNVIEPQTTTADYDIPEYQPQTSTDYDLSGYQRKQAAAQMESTLAGLKGAFTKSMEDHDFALDKLPQTYQAARNDAAAQAAIAQKNFDERAVASGLNSGASGQAALDASAVYRGTLGQLNQAQANAAAEIDHAKADLRAQYETAIAQAQAEGEASLAQALYQELVRGQMLRREDEQLAYQREQDALAWEYQREQDADAKALSSALALAGQGSYYALGAYYGWDEQEVDYMNKMYWNAKAKADWDQAVAKAQFMADNLIGQGQMPGEELLAQAGYPVWYAQVLSQINADRLARGA